MTFVLVISLIVILITTMEMGSDITALRKEIFGKKKSSWRPEPLEMKTSHEHKWTKVESAYPRLLNEDMTDAPFVVAMWCRGCDTILTVPEFEALEESAPLTPIQQQQDERMRSREAHRPQASQTPPRPPRRKGEVVGGIAPLFEDPPCSTCSKTITEFVYVDAEGQARCHECHEIGRAFDGMVDHQVRQYHLRQPL